jgi:hypothetical protein
MSKEHQTYLQDEKPPTGIMAGAVLTCFKEEKLTTRLLSSSFSETPAFSKRPIKSSIRLRHPSGAAGCAGACGGGSLPRVALQNLADSPRQTGPGVCHF